MANLLNFPQSTFSTLFGMFHLESIGKTARISSHCKFISGQSMTKEFQDIFHITY